MAESRKEDKNKRGVSPLSEFQSSNMIVVRVVPRSSKITIAQESSGNFKIHLTAPPVDGAANTQLLRLLRDKLSLPARNIVLISGETAKVKRFEIFGLSLNDVSERLLK